MALHNPQDTVQKFLSWFSKPFIIWSNLLTFPASSLIISLHASPLYLPASLISLYPWAFAHASYPLLGTFSLLLTFILYIYSFQICFSYRLLQLLSSVPCAIQKVFACLLYVYYCMYVNPSFLIYSSLTSFPFGNRKFVFYVCRSVSAL